MLVQDGTNALMPFPFPPSPGLQGRRRKSLSVSSFKQEESLKGFKFPRFVFSKSSPASIIPLSPDQTGNYPSYYFYCYYQLYISKPQLQVGVCVCVWLYTVVKIINANFEMALSLYCRCEEIFFSPPPVDLTVKRS